MKTIDFDNIYLYKARPYVNRIKVLFTKKKLPTERKFEKCCEPKQMHKGHISWRRKNFTKKKSKLTVWHSYIRKKLKLHLRDSKKRFFFQFRNLRSDSTYSLYLRNVNFRLV